MKELDFTGEWLTRDGSKASVIRVKDNYLHPERVRFIGKIGTDDKSLKGSWDADGRCPGFSGWDLQKRLDGYPTE